MQGARSGCPWSRQSTHCPLPIQIGVQGPGSLHKLRVTMAPLLQSRVVSSTGEQEFKGSPRYSGRKGPLSITQGLGDRDGVTGQVWPHWPHPVFCLPKDCLRGIRNFLRTHRSMASALTGLGLATTVYPVPSSVGWGTRRTGGWQAGGRGHPEGHITLHTHFPRPTHSCSAPSSGLPSALAVAWIAEASTP